MSILVTGAGGLLGKAVCQAARSRGQEVVGLSRAQLDITDLEAVRAAVRRHAPEVLFNCAAYSAVDRAESEPEKALLVNRDGAGGVARAATEAGVKVVHVSTDYVFDGRKDSPYLTADQPAPLNAYGISKLAGEGVVREAAKESLVVRTSWLFGEGSPGFVGVMKRLLVEPGDPLRVVADEVSRPTFVGDLAPALLDLAEAGGRGCLHLGGSGFCSRLALAEEVRRVMGGKREILGVSAEVYGAPARRPGYSVLELGEAEGILGRGLPHWKEALGTFLLGGRV